MTSIFIVSAISSLFLVSTAIDGPNRSAGKYEFTVVIGQQNPLALACFHNARDGDDHFDALSPCDRALEEETLTNRVRATVHANRGVIQFNVGDYEAAVSDFSTALDMGIHVQAKMYANRGLSYEALGLDYLAKADYEAALAIRPDHQVANHRLEELHKPLFDRSSLPRKITADAPVLWPNLIMR